MIYYDTVTNTTAVIVIVMDSTIAINLNICTICRLYMCSMIG